MDTQKSSKLNYLLQYWPKGAVVTDRWLKQLGINKDLKHSYIRSKWFSSIGHGAVIRTGDNVTWIGGLFTLQDQLHIPIHISGKTALELRGAAHYIKFDNKTVNLCIKKRTTVPKWFKNYKWGIEFKITSSDFLPDNLAIEQIIQGEFMINISSPERAILELIHFVPDKQSFEESYLILENLISLRPLILQSLLEQCKSIKVKRIFLFLAEKLSHPWFDRLDLSKISVGRGKRSITKDGIFDSKYQITIPKEFKNEK